MTRVLYLFPLVALLFSCSSWHCRKCFDNARVKTDTLVVRDTILIPGIHADTVFQRLNANIDFDSLKNARPDMFPESLPCPDLPPVMQLKKGKLKALITQTDSGLSLDVNNPPDTVVRFVNVPCPTNLNTGYAWWTLIVSGLVGAGVIAVLMLLRRVR